MSNQNVRMILITNRHYYINRAIAYYKKKGVEASLVIADGCERPWTEAKKTSAHYHHLPDYELLTDRISHVFALHEFEYACLCADDDFIVPERVYEGADFLSKNPEYASTFGRYIRFAIHNSSVQFSEQYHQRLYRDFTSSTAQQRVQDFLLNYIQLFYCVHRKDVFKEFLEHNSMHCMRFVVDVGAERLLSLLALLHGKVKYFDKIWCFREQENVKTPRRKDYFDIAEAWVTLFNVFRGLLQENNAYSDAVAVSLRQFINLGLHQHFSKAIHAHGQPTILPHSDNTSNFKNSKDSLQSSINIDSLTPQYDTVRWKDFSAPKEAFAELLLITNLIRQDLMKQRTL